jgi:hypothetical protein
MLLQASYAEATVEASTCAATPYHRNWQGDRGIAPRYVITRLRREPPRSHDERQYGKSFTVGTFCVLCYTGRARGVFPGSIAFGNASPFAPLSIIFDNISCKGYSSERSLRLCRVSFSTAVVAYSGWPLQRCYRPDQGWREEWRGANGYASTFSVHETHTWVPPSHASFQPVHTRFWRWWLCPSVR